MTEEQIQSTCFMWFWNTYPSQRQMLFHVQQKARNAAEGNKFKSMGVVKGVSDMIWVGLREVVFIEFKTEKGFQSHEQKMFAGLVSSRGHRYTIVRSVEEFKNLMYELISNVTEKN